MKTLSVRGGLLALGVSFSIPLSAQVVEAELNTWSGGGTDTIEIIGPESATPGTTLRFSLTSSDRITYALGTAITPEGTGLLVEDSHLTNITQFFGTVEQTSADVSLTIRNSYIQAQFRFQEIGLYVLGGADMYLTDSVIRSTNGMVVQALDGGDVFLDNFELQAINAGGAGIDGVVAEFWLSGGALTVDLTGGHTFADTFDLMDYDPMAFEDLYGFSPDATNLSISIEALAYPDDTNIDAGLVMITRTGNIVGGYDRLYPVGITATAIVPEPGTYAMLGGLAALGFAFCCRRKA
ncbi:MAG: hypothetical protein E1N59_403 [Puniceicoccaceae bacterium 5H]|nr:MAG: hypothetical protein E1N59_403 [Puniceicoccaceae bacterium 5H]